MLRGKVPRQTLCVASGHLRQKQEVTCGDPRQRPGPRSAASSVGLPPTPAAWHPATCSVGRLSGCLGKRTRHPLILIVAHSRVTVDPRPPLLAPPTTPRTPPHPPAPLQLPWDAPPLSHSVRPSSVWHGFEGGSALGTRPAGGLGCFFLVLLPYIPLCFVPGRGSSGAWASTPPTMSMDPPSPLRKKMECAQLVGLAAESAYGGGIQPTRTEHCSLSVSPSLSLSLSLSLKEEPCPPRPTEFFAQELPFFFFAGFLGSTVACDGHTTLLCSCRGMTAGTRVCRTGGR